MIYHKINRMIRRERKMRLLNVLLSEKKDLTHLLCKLGDVQSGDVRNICLAVICEDVFSLFTVYEQLGSYDEFSYEYSVEDTKRIVEMANEAGSWSKLLEPNFTGFLMADRMDSLAEFFKSKGIEGKYSHFYIVDCKMVITHRDGKKAGEPGFDDSPII